MCSYNICCLLACRLFRLNFLNCLFCCIVWGECLDSCRLYNFNALKVIFSMRSARPRLFRLATLLPHALHSHVFNESTRRNTSSAVRVKEGFYSEMKVNLFCRTTLNICKQLCNTRGKVTICRNKREASMSGMMSFPNFFPFILAK